MLIADEKRCFKNTVKGAFIRCNIFEKKFGFCFSFILAFYFKFYLFIITATLLKRFFTNRTVLIFGVIEIYSVKLAATDMHI